MTESMSDCMNEWMLSVFLTVEYTKLLVAAAAVGCLVNWNKLNFIVVNKTAEQTKKKTKTKTK